MEILLIDAIFDLAGQGPNNKDPALVERTEYGPTRTTSHQASDLFHGSAVPLVLVGATVLYVIPGPLGIFLTDAPSSISYCSRPVRVFSVHSLLPRTI